ncbi:MAG: hypothetical protein HZC40_03110 [Chloroflexi bacterium]|nr:hypothetical protein [Chloroflexota bacterium]
MGKRGPAPRRENVEWSSAFAYAVGLITTDGCLSPDGRHLSFTSKDVDLIETFKQCLDLKNKIGWKIGGFGTIAHYIQFGDKVLYQWLMEIGVTPQKSKTIGALDIPDEYFFDFLRGHLDGDGTIKSYPDPVYPNSQRLYVAFHSASLSHLEWLQQRIRSLLELKGFTQKLTGEYALTYAKQESIQLLRSLYYRNDLPCLDRKRKIAEPYLISNSMPRW